MPALYTYYWSNCSPIDANTDCFLYSDATLTTPVADGFYSGVGNGSDVYEVAGGAGFVISKGTCGSGITTTTNSNAGTVLFSATDNASPLFSIGSFSWRRPDIAPSWYSNIREEDSIGNPLITSFPFSGRMRADLAWNASPTTYTNMSIDLAGIAGTIHKMKVQLYKNGGLIQTNIYTNSGYDPGCTSGTPSGNVSGLFTVTFSNTDFLEFRASLNGTDGCP
jgi:hypothetical protein